MEPEETSVAREWLCKHFSTATVRNNRGTVGGGALCWVRAEAISREESEVVRLPRRGGRACASSI
jgi:hypothetical protein